MQDKVGQEFDAVVTGASEWGLYVEEKETKAEGMVRLTNIRGDVFAHDPQNYRVVGSRTKKSYQLGDPIRVRLTAANLAERQLDFAVV